MEPTRSVAAQGTAARQDRATNPLLQDNRINSVAASAVAGVGAFGVGVALLTLGLVFHIDPLTIAGTLLTPMAFAGSAALIRQAVAGEDRMSDADMYAAMAKGAQP